MIKNAPKSSTIIIAFQCCGQELARSLSLQLLSLFILAKQIYDNLFNKIIVLIRILLWKKVKGTRNETSKNKGKRSEHKSEQGYIFTT